ncbi:PLP-dependent aspartate aminotransferase family protein [Campylobacter sp. MIT 21-1685]|uniref:trans-sulfuration enzyme family protein n=1 Tax=unclassified Campylobacter TaxID=2593542 RepID=UPI00224AC280|nr:MULTISPECIES: PLP-dependent aspartate aminotransferase family protein [unclassified Campylobacter]MCX2682593.1 PLP-dependent aspartate aminotransferase family protein [Campylobacter sp. MIT 21-1684]MCX2750873.1 PLP-dependent aspartate aminotransferase family protein [Campylobacter sp. MIT 21-1682]MCX2807194.1 PLP-dependent aspartate aminotransferase family protein [Campylobacter sp. MIT 21-1685]
MHLDTALIHAGMTTDSRTGAVNTPIYQTSTFKQQALGENSGYEYSRTKNPTRDGIESLIAELENGKYGFAFSSGMAAISTALALFRSGESILISQNVYGGTFRVLDKVFSQFNISYKIVDTNNLNELENAMDKQVKGILIETPANPLMGVSDIEQIANFAKKKGLISIVDNTFMTPYLQRPLEFGIDIVLHSATKYLGGHSDLIAGLIVVNEEQLATKIAFLQNSIGAILSPFESFLLIRGLKTLGLRMQRHSENAFELASYLQNHQDVEKVFYPLFGENASVHKKQASMGGGMLSFILKKGCDYKKFVKSCKLIALAESLGGVESLLCHPASMTHASIPKELREKLGITENLIRLSVGIENYDDLIKDIEQALKSSKA